MLLRTDQPRARRAQPQRRRVARPPLLGYVAGAGALAVALTTGLMALDPGLRQRAVNSAPPQAAPSEPSRTSVAATAQPAVPAASPAPIHPTSLPASSTEPLPVSATAPKAQPAAVQGREPAETAAIPFAALGPEPVRALPSPHGRGAVIESAAAPLDCFPNEVRAMLAGLAKAAGEIEILSTKELRTDNHAPNSARARLHEDCKAVDLRVKGRIADATSYLRGRSEVASIQPYRNGVIHIDFRDGAKTASAGGPPGLRRPRRAEAAEAKLAEAAPSPAAAPSLFEAAPRPDIAR